MLGLLGVGAGSVLSLFGSENGNNCVAQEFQNIENQLFVQEQQINQIESNLSLSSNFIWNSIATNAGNIAYDEYNALTTSLADINGNGGALEYIYSAAGFYNSDAGALTSETLAQLVSNPTNLAATAEAYNNLVANDLPNIILQISGAKYTAPCEIESGYKVCYKTVTTDNNSVLINLLANTNSYLQAELTNQFNNGENLVPLLDDYNNTIMSYYQQSLSAIQNAYHLAYLANYLNYQTGAGSATGMSDLFAVPDTYYESGISMGGPANATAQQMYNQAQQNLTLMTAALVNQLYTNIIGYIITDVPVGVQVYPNTQQIPYYNQNGAWMYGESINYSSLVGKSLESTPTASQSLIMAMTSAQIGLSGNYQDLANNLKALGGYNPSTNASPNLFFYQYSGLNNVATCIGSLESYNQQYGTLGNLVNAFGSSGSCPSLLVGSNGAAVNQSVFSNATIQPYYTPSGNLPTLTGSVTNNINTIACNDNSVGNLSAWSMYYYMPSSNYPSLGVQGTPYLMCGNWQTTGVTANMSNGQPGIIVNTPSNPYMYPYMLITTIDTNSGTNVYFHGQTTVTGQDSTTFWAIVNGSSGSLTNGNQYPSIMSGWINENWPSGSIFTGNDQLLHTIAVQELLPDGFIAPYAISIGNLNNGQPLYNTNSISFTNMPYSSISQMTNNYPWTPVTSNNPIFASASQVSALEVNGYLLSVVGSPTTAQGTPLTTCFVNPNNTSVTNLSTWFIGNSSLQEFPIAALSSFGMTNCYDVYYLVTPNAFPGSVLYNASLYAVGISTLISPSGINELVVQTDGNLVLYSNGIATWASNTSGSGSNNYLAMQNNGNLVLYTSSGNVVWSSGTTVAGNGISGYYLSMQDDGNLVMYNQADQVVWATGTSTAN